MISFYFSWTHKSFQKMLIYGTGKNCLSKRVFKLTRIWVIQRIFYEKRILKVQRKLISIYWKCQLLGSKLLDYTISSNYRYYKEALFYNWNKGCNAVITKVALCWIIFNLFFKGSANGFSHIVPNIYIYHTLKHYFCW